MSEFIKLYKIEKAKFNKKRFFILSLIYLFITLAIVLIQFRSASSKEDILAYYSAYEASIFMKNILSPIFLASLISNAVQVENNHNMWKVIRGIGFSLKDFYLVKFMYVFGKVILLYIFEWILIYGVCRVIGVNAIFPLHDVLIKLIACISISFCIMSFQYLISLKYNNQLIALSSALIGSLFGIVCILVSRVLMHINIYSWFGFLLQIKLENINGEFVRNIIGIYHYPIYMSVLVSIIIFVFINKIKVGE